MWNNGGSSSPPHRLHALPLGAYLELCQIKRGRLAAQAGAGGLPLIQHRFCCKGGKAAGQIWREESAPCGGLACLSALSASMPCLYPYILAHRSAHCTLSQPAFGSAAVLSQSVHRRCWVERPPAIRSGEWRRRWRRLTGEDDHVCTAGSCCWECSRVLLGTVALALAPSPAPGLPHLQAPSLHFKDGALGHD